MACVVATRETIGLRRTGKNLRPNSHLNQNLLRPMLLYSVSADLPYTTYGSLRATVPYPLQQENGALQAHETLCHSPHCNWFAEGSCPSHIRYSSFHAQLMRQLPVWRRVRFPPLQPCESCKATNREPGAWGYNWANLSTGGHKYRGLVLQVGGISNLRQ
jgi:hypothetical protein